MKRFSLYASLLGLFTIALSACKSDEPVPSSFPKKQLVEEFTGQSCGYCPYGMDMIHEFIGDDPNWIMVLHHYGYKADYFSVGGSKTITSALGINSAPNFIINRAPTTYTYNNNSASIDVFGINYIPYIPKTQFESTTYASIELDNRYDASSRTLTVNVSGIIGRTDAPQLQLTVLVKESGMIDVQADYYNTYSGWEQFRHANAVRAFLSAAKGDEIAVKDQKYSATYTLTLNDSWVPENCMVVAFLSEAFKPVVQAEQQPVVSGTKGGADIRHGGIKEVPVPDYYPEPNATDGPSVYTKLETDTLNVAQSMYTGYTSLNVWTVMGYNSSKSCVYNKESCLPAMLLYVFTSSSDTAIPVGTYPVSTNNAVGTVAAGYRNDERHEMEGSRYCLISESSLKSNYFTPKATWLLVDGSLTVTETGWELTGHARNGAEIHAVGSTPIKNLGKASGAPERKSLKQPVIRYE